MNGAALAQTNSQDTEWCDMRWIVPLVHFFASRGVLPLAGFPVAAAFGHHALKVVLVAFGLMFLVSLGAFLLYIFTLPSDRGGVN